MKEFDLKLDYYDLLSLHKAMLEAKFHTNPDNELVSGSPLVAAVYIQVRELLLKSEKAEQWNEWFQLKHRPDYRNRAIMRIKKSERWSNASVGEKKNIADDFLAPFLYDRVELYEIVTEIDQND